MEEAGPLLLNAWFLFVRFNRFVGKSINQVLTGNRIHITDDFHGVFFLHPRENKNRNTIPIGFVVTNGIFTYPLIYHKKATKFMYV